MNWAIDLAERAWLPDTLIRWGIRRLCAQRLAEQDLNDAEQQQQALNQFIYKMQHSPIAPIPEKANEQHYEVPPAFFEEVLGKHLKYSGCYWPANVHGLDQAEAAMLELTCQRAEIHDDMDVLDLGCGWGSLSLWIAERFPSCRVLAVSNSRPQRAYIERIADQRRLNNVKVLTADMNEFSTARRFDRVVSIEMFEHMRNYQALLTRIAEWLKPTGKLFVHIFCHRLLAYEYEEEGADNWMGRHFFSGGIMPASQLPLYFQKDLTMTRHWAVDGRHYQRTANAWLANLDAHRTAVLDLFNKTYGPADAARWIQRWRMFFMACAELFGYRKGQEWRVGHYLFENRPAKTASANGETSDTITEQPASFRN